MNRVTANFKWQTAQFSTTLEHILLSDSIFPETITVLTEISINEALYVAPTHPILDDVLLHTQFAFDTYGDLYERYPSRMPRIYAPINGDVKPLVLTFEDRKGTYVYAFNLDDTYLAYSPGVLDYRTPYEFELADSPRTQANNHAINVNALLDSAHSFYI